MLSIDRRRRIVASLAVFAVAMPALTLATSATHSVQAASLRSWSATVESVVDGDTINVRIGSSNTITTVRVAGVNTNERWIEDSRATECHADQAAERLEQLVGGRTVSLRARSASSSSLDRLLRHVFIDGSNAATTLLDEGWGVPITFSAEPDYAAANTAAALRARSSNKGIWNPRACGAGPSVNSAIEMVTNYDAAGDDRSNPNGEWVQLRNRSGSRIDLAGWQLRDSGLFRWGFPNGAALEAGGRLRVYVGSGRQTATNFFMGKSSSILTNAGDGMYLHDPDFDIRASDIWPCATTCGPVAPLIIDHVQYDAAGDDTTNPNGEWVRIRNVGATTVDLQDWKIQSPPYQMTSIASRPIRPNGIVTVFMGNGRNTSSQLYMNHDAGVLGNTGDTVRLLTPNRDVADCAAWGSVRCSTTSVRSALEVTVNFDAAGDDRKNPNGEWVNITNRSTSTVSLNGFELRSPPHTYRFASSASISAGARLRVYVGTGTDTRSKKFWGKPTSIFGNGGDRVDLVDASGTLLRSFSYPCPSLCGPEPAPLVIDDVRYNAAGNDLTNPNGEWIRIKNVSDEIVDLRDWQIESPPNQINPSASRKMRPGAIVTIFIGRGTNTATRLYWQKSTAMLNNAGDKVRLLSPSRDQADCWAWGSASCSGELSSSASLTMTVNYDAVGDDLQNPNGEWVDITSRSSSSIDLRGYSIDTPGHRYVIDRSIVLRSGQRFRLYIGRGNSSGRIHYWNKSRGILGNSGDTVTLIDANQREVRTVVWS